VEIKENAISKYLKKVNEQIMTNNCLRYSEHDGKIKINRNALLLYDVRREIVGIDGECRFDTYLRESFSLEKDAIQDQEMYYPKRENDIEMDVFEDMEQNNDILHENVH